MYDNTYKEKGSKSPFIELHSEEQQVRSLPLPYAVIYSKKHRSLYELEKAQGIYSEDTAPPHPAFRRTVCEAGKYCKIACFPAHPLSCKMASHCFQYKGEQQCFSYTSNTAFVKLHFIRNCAPTSTDSMFSNSRILLKTAELYGLS